jgi:thiamine kinase-like enzyme
MDKVIKILQMTFKNSDWKICKPQDGQKKECYIAETNGKKVFVKFDVPIFPLKRLGEICVAPKMLASGEYEGTSYIIQEFIDGKYPDREWILKHMAEIARVIKIYHEDEILLEILSREHTTDHDEHIKIALRSIEKQVVFLKNKGSIPEKILNGLSKLKIDAAKFTQTPLVPVHKEPNTKNMLVNKNEIVFIDWDEIVLSDPMADIGLFLWWYFPEEKWKEFFKIYGEELTEEKKKKIYWFTAKSSFEIALWLEEHKSSGKEFYKDFIAALDLQSNPHLIK